MNLIVPSAPGCRGGARLPSALLLALGLLAGAGCQNSAQVTSERQTAPAATARPAVVCVTDFELDPRAIHHDAGVGEGRQGPVGRVGARLSGGSSDPATRSRELVNLMSTTLVKDLTKAGFRTRRLAPGESPGAEGWLLRGYFTSVDEGNRVRRSMIGLGQGQTDVQVVATVHDLSQGPPHSLYEVATDANSGSKVGAAPTLALGPYGAAARFVMAGQDVEKNIKQTAGRIVERLNQPFLPSP